MGTFNVVWFGQLVSVLGSSLTSFALGIWIYQKTGSATQFALITLFATLPFFVLSPLAGAFVDRWDRRTVMILGDSAAALSTVAVAALLFSDQLEVWHLYASTAARSVFGTFQWLAWSASTSSLVDEPDLGRANGMTQLSQSLAQLVAPALAGALLGPLKLEGLFLIDFATFLVALITLSFVRFPPLKTVTARQSLWRDIAYGLPYIVKRPGLLALLLFFAAINLLVGTLSILTGPLVLAFAPASTYGLLQSVGGIGMVVGSLGLSAWGGPKRSIDGVLVGFGLGGVWMALAGLKPSVLLVGIAAFLFFLNLPIIFGSAQTIWQKKVEPAVQGRVFAMNNLISGLSFPLASLIAGPLAERGFEPLLAPGGPLAASVGLWIGVGPGRGIGLMFIVLGALTSLLALGGYLYRPLRLVETLLPDAAQAENNNFAART